MTEPRSMLHSCVRSICLLALFAACITGLSHRAVAQLQTTPFLAKDGLSSATSAARDSLGDDATLMYIGTFGDYEIDLGSFTLHTVFDLTNGKANTWGYVFYSKSQDRTLVFAVVKLVAFYQAFGLGALPFPARLSDTALTLSGTYGNSDAFVNRLMEDSIYNSFRIEYPDATPDLVSLGQLVPGDSLPIPPAFPLDEPTWSVSFLGGGDSSLTCFVTTATGETLCRQGIAVSGVDAPTVRQRSAGAITLTPNPASGYVRVQLDTPVGMALDGATHMAIYDEAGREVLDLTDRLIDGGGHSAVIDARGLPAGTYYVRARGTDFSAVAGLIVSGR